VFLHYVLITFILEVVFPIQFCSIPFNYTFTYIPDTLSFLIPFHFLLPFCCDLLHIPTTEPEGDMGGVDYDSIYTVLPHGATLLFYRFLPHS